MASAAWAPRRRPLRGPEDGPAGGREQAANEGFRSTIVRVCKGYGFDIEAPAPSRWWEGLSSADRRVFTTAWDRLEAVTEQIGIGNDVWAVVLGECFGDWPGPWWRVIDEEEASDAGA